jgi:hypothetical protein
MLAARRFSVRHARFFEWLYDVFSGWLLHLHPLWQAVGYARAEPAVAAVERRVKDFLFDCRMCGHCVLGSSGMACPANCPKNLRNGPCGGVRQDGMCEVIPDLRCVWLEAVEGSLRMRRGAAIRDLQPPLDHRRCGSSSWLRVTREAAAARAVAQPRE